MLSKNLKFIFGKIVRVGFNAILLAGMVIPGIHSQAVKASSEPSSGPQKGQNGPVGPLADEEYTLTITSGHGTVTVTPNQLTYHAGDVVHLTVTADPGYKFDHWSYTGGAAIYQPGAVAISFDDGYPSTYTDVYPYMKSKGVLGTLYFICNWANKSWSLTTAQLQELDANGWSIANHTSSHGYLDALTEPQQETELLGCKNFLDGIGLTKASSHVDYPYNAWNTDTLAAMTNTGMLTGRLSSGTTFDPNNANLLGLPSGSGDTLATVEQWTDYAVANHQIYLYHGHDIGQSGELSLADFEAWIDYLVANHIPTLTINDVYARTFSPIDITISGNTSITANYIQTRTISGNAGVGGAVLNYGGVSPVVADVSGNYTITVPYGWSGTVTPSKLGSSFTPTHITYSGVITNYSLQNYSTSPAIAPKARDDYDGDGKTDAVKFVDGSGSAWWYKSSTSAWDGKWLGTETMNYVGASDFDGDGKTDLAKYIPSTGAVWYYLSNTSTWDGKWLGSPSEAFTYVAGSDFDGDGKTDPAKFVPSTGAVWYLQSSTGTWDGKWLGPEALTYVSGSDFDGDGKTDPAKFVSSTGVLWYLGSQTGTWTGVYLGSETFSYIPASDFDGDGKTDPGKFTASTGVLWYLSSLSSSWVGVPLGTGTYTYVPGCDFNGDGKTDPAKYDESTHNLSWYDGSTWNNIDMGTDTFTIGNGQ